MRCDNVAAVNEGGHMTVLNISSRISKSEGQVISVKVQNCRHFFIRQLVQVHPANQTLVPVRSFALTW